MNDHDDPRRDDEYEDVAPEEDSAFAVEHVEDQDDNGWKPTLKELQTAIDDEEHPHHEEALQQNKELAEKLRPAMESLRSTILAQTKFHEPLIKQISGITDTSRVFDQLVPKIDFPTAAMAPADLRPVVNPQIEMMRTMRENTAQIEESMREAAEARAARLNMEDERAEKTLAVPESMDANLRLLNDKIEGVDQRIESGNNGAGKAFWWTVGVATATLIATMIGVILTVFSR